MSVRGAGAFQPPCFPHHAGRAGVSVRGACVDIANINRIRRMLSRYPQRLARAVFGSAEAVAAMKRAMRGGQA